MDSFENDNDDDMPVEDMHHSDFLDLMKKYGQGKVSAYSEVLGRLSTSNPNSGDSLGPGLELTKGRLSELMEHNVSPYGYVQLRASGRTLRNDLDWGHEYGEDEQIGYSHDNAIALHDLGVNLGDFARGRNAGIPEETLLRAHKHGVSLHHFTYGLENFIPEHELYEAHYAGAHLGNYVWKRTCKRSHEQAIAEALAEGNDYESGPRK